ncbi:hypothetical protein ABH930_000302 [Kitasatospora sp. GAS204A]|uniref:DUF2637 domain-containing protein n=1 Tax=unclassified Kitasatospora TaxID=2633591 RepID=UPI002473987E|nr:DUF2637 domain-containing protein [Kitasatospora sp. GAS204B]MDH6116883.1 hypothetical protein [Kitasatospora sp. GAS204B]
MAVAQTTATSGLTVHTPVMTPSRTIRHWRPTLWLAVIAAGATIALTGVTFWLSYEALHDLAASHHLVAARAWAWPATIDAFIIVGEVLILRASLLRRIDWLAVLLVALGSVGSIILNIVSVGAHVDGTTRVVAAVPPVAALLAFTALMRQIYRALSTDAAPRGGEALTGVSGPSDEEFAQARADALVAVAAQLPPLPPMPPEPPILPPAPPETPAEEAAPEAGPRPIVYSNPGCYAIRPLYDAGARPGTAAMRQALLDGGHGNVSDGMIRGTLRAEIERHEPHLAALPSAVPARTA